MGRTEKIHGYRGYIIDVGSMYSKEDDKFYGYYRVDKDHKSIHRVERTKAADNQDLAETYALQEGEDYVDSLLGPITDSAATE